MKTEHYLMKYMEAALTTTCIDELNIGRDRFILLRLGEGRVDYTALNLSDVISAFQDLGKIYDFGRNYIGVELTQDVSVLHLDIHGENLMRFDGKLRLIDFGLTFLFDPNQAKEWRKAKMVPYDRNNPNLYFQYDDFSKQPRYDPSNSSWDRYIKGWQKAYRVAPEVLVCRACNRQYPAGLGITECLRCGSKKIETAKLRKADIEGTARLKGVSPGTIGDNPYANKSVSAVDPREYGCIVLTAVLIKEVWAATEKGRDLGMGGTVARSIVNVDVYSQARKGLHTFKAAAPEAGRLVELLLLWFDEMMRRLFDGEEFSARDAVKFFGGVATQASRERRQSASF
jgi:hypothetical protein